jgi:MGT family glycosyltransferase
MSTDGLYRFLFAMFQGGGNIPLILPIAARLVERGHTVRVLAGPGIRRDRLPLSERFRERIVATGAKFIPLVEPKPHPLDTAPPVRGLVRSWTPRRYAIAVIRARVTLWSAAWAEQVLGEFHNEPTDVLAADFILPGALAAAEAAGVPAAALVHTVGWRPMAGMPPPGLGELPAQGLRDRLRHLADNTILRRIAARDGLPALNRARRQLGLRPLRAWFDQYDAAARVLVLVNQAFDFPARRLAPNVRYVGTPFDDADVPATAWTPPWSDDDHPLVLVSLSTLAQGQAPLMQRILAALAPLPVRAVVTLGPALDRALFQPPPNVVLEPFVPHAVVLPHVRAMVTQCGTGTLAKALAHGVPLVCIPLGGDQPDNAARVVARGAGVRLAGDAAPEQIRRAIERVVAEPDFRAGALRFTSAMEGEDATEHAARELESLAGLYQTLKQGGHARLSWDHRW